MIWLLVAIIIALAILFVWPTLFTSAPVSGRSALTRELAASKDQLAQIDAEIASGFLDEDGASRARRAMERRVLKLGDRLDALDASENDGTLPVWIKFGAPVFIAVFAAGLYPFIGSPDYKRITAEEARNASIPEALRDMSLPELETMLTQRMADNNVADPVGYVLLARARMGLNKFDAALEAYETAYRLSENDARIGDELQQARDFIAQEGAPPSSSAPQITEEAQNEMAALSADDQNARIRGMVDGLAARLDADPQDLQGWLRLIRARTVLGEQTIAETSYAQARTVFAGDEAALSALAALADELPLTNVSEPASITPE